MKNLTDPTFTVVSTVWGERHVHVSRRVWCVFYEHATRQRGKTLVRGIWRAYYGTRDADPAKPWCSANWAIGGEGAWWATEAEAKQACLDWLAAEPR